MAGCFLPAYDDGGLQFTLDDMRAAGEAIAGPYADASPYPHCVIDNFLPTETVQRCLAHFPAQAEKDSVSFDRDQERFKTSYNPDRLSAPMQELFHALNARPMLEFLEGLTGISGLIPDPYYIGGGFHEIKQGGHLSVHADFNHHKKLDLERRINLLIYLNEGWEDSYGGQLELWRNDMSACEVSVTPVLNRAVVFNTTANSNHGNPNPIAHPQNISRKSIALYYYTATWDETRHAKTTQFRPRKNTDDRADYAVKSDEIARDFLPPIMYRGYRKIVQKLAR